MDRKEYWEKYVEYWKAITDEAGFTGGGETKVQKLVPGDFKIPGIEADVRLFELMEYSGSDKLLDFGCGSGRFYPYLSGVADYYGIDISQSMIEECVRQFPDAHERFIVSEGERLPFTDGFFDKIVCVGVFDACYQELALAEMFRVCRERGCVLLTGKNTAYHEDDEQSLNAEDAARRKGHPNYFTNVKAMKEQLAPFTQILYERYFERRGDWGQGKFQERMPVKFYEWALILKKIKTPDNGFEKFSDAYSETWRRLYPERQD